MLFLIYLVNKGIDEKQLDVTVVNEIVELPTKINNFHNPIFYDNGKPVMKNWKEFVYTGLCKCDYARTKFYKVKFDDTNL